MSLSHRSGEDCRFDEKVSTQDVLHLIRLFRTGAWAGEKKLETVRLILWILGCSTHYAEQIPAFGNQLAEPALTRDEEMDDLAEYLEDQLSYSSSSDPMGSAVGELVPRLVALAWLMLVDLDLF